MKSSTEFTLCSIRLLRIMPNKDATAPIKCQLFDYSLDLDKGIHLYEAISYVWGGLDKTMPTKGKVI